MTKLYELEGEVLKIAKGGHCVRLVLAEIEALLDDLPALEKELRSRAIDKWLRIQGRAEEQLARLRGEP